jgi:Protein of Unknown function (DUF2784)
MFYRLAAELVIALHLALIVFGVTGSFIAWRWRRVMWPHLVVLGLIALVNVTGSPCPITDWEKSLMRRGGEQPFPGGFNEHYLVKPIHPKGITPTVDLVIYLVAIVPNVVGYTGLWIRNHRRRLALSSGAAPARPRSP